MLTNKTPCKMTIVTKRNGIDVHDSAEGMFFSLVMEMYAALLLNHRKEDTHFVISTLEGFVVVECDLFRGEAYYSGDYDHMDVINNALLDAYELLEDLGTIDAYAKNGTEELIKPAIYKNAA